MQNDELVSKAWQMIRDYQFDRISNSDYDKELITLDRFLKNHLKPEQAPEVNNKDVFIFKPAKKRYEYKTLIEKNISDIDCKVTDKLNNGWQLAGSQYVLTMTGTNWYYQPMIRLIDEDNND
jgi:hypothetical protein